MTDSFVASGVQFVKLPAPEEHPDFGYNGFAPGTSTLPRGHKKDDDRRKLDLDLIYERDSAVKMRDDVTIFTDVFRASNNKQPAIIAYSPYGKTGTGPQTLESMAPFRAGIPFSATTGYEKFEALDPACWAAKGYAIVQPDARGAAKSEGRIAFWGSQEGHDIHDLIDWIVRQPWSDGNVGMAGNSWLSIAQTMHATVDPHPNLRCIAPWEGMTDAYRQVVMRGGMPWQVGFGKVLTNGFAGPDAVEDIWGSAKLHPFFDEYWKDKVHDVTKLKVPHYGTASYQSGLHSLGSFDTFRSSSSNAKWLRVHHSQEWHDLYQPKSQDDLAKFFGHYLQGLDNGWEHTPPVRLSLLGFGTVPDVVNQTEIEWPLSRAVNTTYFLDATTGAASLTPAAEEGSVSYNSHHRTDHVTFRLHFDQATQVVGYPKIRLFMSTLDSDEMDVVAIIRKLDRNGNELERLNYDCGVPYNEVPAINTSKLLGPQAVLRFSHACTYDPARSTPNEPFYNHDRREPIPRGRVVEAELGFWPIGFVCAPGEGISVWISGHDMAHPDLPPENDELTDTNVGTHTVHTGGKYRAELLLPLVQ